MAPDKPNTVGKILSYAGIVLDFHPQMYYMSNSYTTVCPAARGDDPRAVAIGLSYVQVDDHGITIPYHIHQCRPCTS